MSELVVTATLFGSVITGFCAVLTVVSIKTSKDIKNICADTKTIVKEIREMDKYTKVHMRQLHEEHKEMLLQNNF
ncbi:MAG: hypothetical protein QMD21_06680 [Candidatus Thermoplasmatota archaeon]|nr:hypothetical protein [Candidatus Thermoplasmatota archaeon]